MLLRDTVYSALRSDIIACRLSPGSELREPDLVTRYATGRSPVRDALLRLESDGLVTVVPRQFYRVTPISLRDAKDLLALRRILEPCAAGEAVYCVDRGAIEALLAAVEYQPGTDFIDYNRNFHCALARCARNRRLAESCVRVIEQSERLVRVSIEQMEGRNPKALIAEHRAIVAAVNKVDARKCSSLVRAHIDAAAKRILDALRRQAVVNA